MKKTALLLVMTGMMSVSAWASASERAFSLIVAPARFSVIQVMFDVIDQRPAVLVSYQGEASTPNPALHVWSGVTWNPIGLHELRELSFLQRTPERVILIGDDNLLPVAVRDSLAWMPEVVYIRELENAALLNELGRIVQWSNREWRWFAKRYNLTIEDEAAPLRRSSWYDQTGPLDRPGQTSYQPAPEGTPADRRFTEPVTMTVMPPANRPSDLPAPAAAPATTSELDDLIQALEQQNAPRLPAAPEVESFPIK